MDVKRDEQVGFFKSFRKSSQDTTVLMTPRSLTQRCQMIPPSCLTGEIKLMPQLMNEESDGLESRK